MRGLIEVPERRPSRSGNRMVLVGGLVLSAMLAVPIVAVTALQIGVNWSCTTETLASGVAPGKIEWRITKMTCPDAGAPFYDVAFAAEDKTLVTALTSRGAPVPVEVVRLDDEHMGIRLDRPAAGGTSDLVRVRQRKSGSPVQRIDLEAGTAGVRSRPRG